MYDFYDRAVHIIPHKRQRCNQKISLSARIWQKYVQATSAYIILSTNMGAVFLPENLIISQDVENEESTNTLYIISDKGNIKVVEHFTGKQTYEDIIKAALRREFSE